MFYIVVCFLWKYEDINEGKHEKQGELSAGDEHQEKESIMHAKLKILEYLQDIYSQQEKMLNTAEVLLVNLQKLNDNLEKKDAEMKLLLTASISSRSCCFSRVARSLQFLCQS